MRKPEVNRWKNFLCKSLLNMGGQFDALNNLILQILYLIPYYKWLQNLIMPVKSSKSARKYEVPQLWPARKQRFFDRLTSGFLLRSRFYLFKLFSVFIHSSGRGEKLHTCFEKKCSKIVKMQIESKYSRSSSYITVLSTLWNTDLFCFSCCAVFEVFF